MLEKLIIRVLQSLAHEIPGEANKSDYTLAGPAKGE